MRTAWNESAMRSHRLTILAGALLLLVVRTGAAVAQELNVAQVIADFGFPPDAAERIRRGEVLEADPSESSDRELAVGLTFLVKQSPATIADAFRKAVDLKEDSKLAASTPLRDAGTPADFETLVLEPDGAAEARRYLGARAGETLNLSPQEIGAFNALAAADDRAVGRVEDQLKQTLLDRYRSYVANGLGGIAPYARSSGLQEPSRDLRGAVEAAAPLLGKYAPAMLELLRAYPRDKPADLKESFYWLRFELDGRPNYTLRHRLALPVGSTVVVADREFYVSQPRLQYVPGDRRTDPRPRRNGGVLSKSSVHRSGCGLWFVRQKRDRTRCHGRAADGDFQALARRVSSELTAWRLFLKGRRE
jgi:hypothetical protein